MLSKLNMARENTRMCGYTLTEILIVVVLIMVLIALAIPRFVAKRPNKYGAHMACISNLRIIDGAEGQWALELQKKKTDTPAPSDLQPYIGRGSAGGLPTCPADPKQTFDTSYTLHNVASKPTCKIMPSLHVLP